MGDLLASVARTGSSPQCLVSALHLQPTSSCAGCATIRQRMHSGDTVCQANKRWLIGLAVLLAVVAVTEVSYVNFAPDSNANGADSGKAYTMNYTIEEWEKTETLFIGNDQTAQFSFTYDEMFTASLGIQFVISYEESNEVGTSNCDDVTVEPDFSNTAGPHDEVDDSAKSTSTCDASEQLMASIVTDNSLIEFGSTPGNVHRQWNHERARK